MMLWLSLRMKLRHIEANVGIFVPRYHNVCFFQSQRYWPHPPGGSIPGDCPCPKMGGASAPVGGVHDGAQPSPPMTCQMPKGHLMENKDITILSSFFCGSVKLSSDFRKSTLARTHRHRHFRPLSFLPWSLTPSL